MLISRFPKGYIIHVGTYRPLIIYNSGHLAGLRAYDQSAWGFGPDFIGAGNEAACLPGINPALVGRE